MSDRTGMRNHPKSRPGIADADQKMTQGIEQQMNQINVANELTTGLKDLDDLLGGGLQRGQLVLVDGPSGIGKTALGLGIATANAHKGVPAAFHSLDKQPEHLGARLLATVGGADLRRLRSGQLSDDDVTRCHFASDQLSHFPMWVPVRDHRTVAQIAKEAR
ncbi:DnaB-like helicase C-terminal domain-containing protein [Chitinimonas arctica]|nr:DnaB-like helicase C-terminal domain-containing protein [Chitinimonas arctica]